MVNEQKRMQKQPKSYFSLNKKKYTKLYILSTFNNVILNLYYKNKMIFVKSCGTKVIKGAQRHNLHAVQNLIDLLKKKLNYYKIKQIIIYLKGINYKNYYIIKNLYNYKIIKLVNLTNLPHNGCKLKKKKRR